MLTLLETRSIFECALGLDKEGLTFTVETLSSRVDPRLQRVIADLSFFGRLGGQKRMPRSKALHCLRALENEKHKRHAAGNSEDAFGNWSNKAIYKRRWP